MDGMDELRGADVVYLKVAIGPGNKDLVEICGQCACLASEDSTYALGRGYDRGIVLVGIRLPHLNCFRSTTNNPVSQDCYLVDRLDVVGLEGVYMLPSFVGPHASMRAIDASPSNKDSISVGISRRNFGGKLRAGKKDKVQAAADVICLYSTTDGGSDLESSFAQRNRGEGDGGGRD